MPAEVVKVKIMHLEIAMTRDVRKVNAKSVRISGRVGAG
jgi:hypothetical protein